VYAITCSLNSVCPVTIDNETQEKLKSMFEDISGVLDKVGRQLSYNYMIHKMLQVIHREDLVFLFPFTKSWEKLNQQDLLWKHICQELWYPFFPS
jgi:NADH:ubiquinone oxidoreductase subunit 3 (subunit A)